MILRFWKLSLAFHKYPIIGWALGLSYFDGGLRLTLFKYEIDFDWGYYESQFSWSKYVND